MTFQGKTDLYMTLALTHVSGELYKAKLGAPIDIRPGEEIQVALCNISYSNSRSAFWNAPVSVFEIYNEKMCKDFGPSVTPILRDDGAEAIDVDDLSSRTSPPSLEEVDKMSPFSNVVFIRGWLENGEYSLESLCSSLNSEIQSKMPSTFRKDQCCFIYNPVIDRAEIRIDGNKSIPPEDRFTLVVYSPLSAYLGLIDRVDRRATFAFVSILCGMVNSLKGGKGLKMFYFSVFQGAPAGHIKEEMISNSSHATAKYHSILKSPNFMFVYLDVLEPQQTDNRFAPLLTFFPRPEAVKGRLHWNVVDERQYKPLNPSLNGFRELFFKFETESRLGYIELSNIRLTLHFIKK